MKSLQIHPQIDDRYGSAEESSQKCYPFPALIPGFLMVMPLRMPHMPLDDAFKVLETSMNAPHVGEFGPLYLRELRIDR